MKFELIHTKRLTLRKIDIEVLRYVYKYFSDKELIDFLDLNSIEELDKEKNKFNTGLVTHNKKILYFQIIENKNEKIIGWCGFHTWYIDHDRAEIGYGLYDERWKNQGMMTEVLPPIIEYGFSQMNLQRIEAFISPNNIPSLKLVKKLSFKKEGLLINHYLSNGTHEDSEVYSLLNKKYNKTNGN
jgi:ribosomal-protein-alanine N-acetyltransferase